MMSSRSAESIRAARRSAATPAVVASCRRGSAESRIAGSGGTTRPRRRLEVGGGSITQIAYSGRTVAGRRSRSRRRWSRRRPGLPSVRGPQVGERGRGLVDFTAQHDRVVVHTTSAAVVGGRGVDAMAPSPASQDEPVASDRRQCSPRATRVTSTPGQGGGPDDPADGARAVHTYRMPRPYGGRHGVSRGPPGGIAPDEPMLVDDGVRRGHRTRARTGRSPRRFSSAASPSAGARRSPRRAGLLPLARARSHECMKTSAGRTGRSRRRAVAAGPGMAEGLVATPSSSAWTAAAWCCHARPVAATEGPAALDAAAGQEGGNHSTRGPYVAGCPAVHRSGARTVGGLRHQRPKPSANAAWRPPGRLGSAIRRALGEHPSMAAEPSLTPTSMPLRSQPCGLDGVRTG